MRVLILGGDGYLGWPTAMYLARHGHEVGVVDNYLRRQLCLQYDTAPLFQVPSLPQRAALWEAASGLHVRVFIGDLADWEIMVQVIREFGPEAVVHFAEQPSAPFSMIDYRTARLTLHNNLGVTLNLIHALKKFAPEAHIVKLGTMGEYGTPNIDIEEGWIEIEHKGRKDRFLFPRQAGSLYHTTKIMDTDLLWFYVRTWQLRVTDLMQGPVYGIETYEAQRESLMPAFNYDEIFGTVINRFVVQAVAGFPLTVFGKGGQTRGYLNIIDTLQCIRIVCESPAAPGELRIFNQFVETFSVRQLAEKVKRVGDHMGFNVTIQHMANPRQEAEEHYYNPTSIGLPALGFEPHYLTDECLGRMLEVVARHKEQINKSNIVRNIRWR